MDAHRPGAPLLSRRLQPDEHRQVLHDAGLRATQPRLLVLDLLHRWGGHRTADDVLTALGDAERPLPRATVYKVLRDLTDRGLVMTADAGPGSVLYEAADAWHHHLVCRSCGEVVDVPCLVGEKPCLEPDAVGRGDRLAGAVIDEAQIVFRGRCAVCAAA